MRRLFAIVILFAAAVPAGAQVHLEGWISTLRSTGDNRILDAPVPVDLALTSGFGFGAGATAGLGSRLEIAGRLSRVTPDASIRAGSFRLDAGSIPMTLADLALRIRLVESPSVRLYGGVGAVHAQFGAIESDLLRFVDLDGIELEPASGVLLEGGISIPLGDRLGVDGNVRYIPVETALERSDLPVEIDLNPLVISLGVRFRIGS